MIDLLTAADMALAEIRKHDLSTETLEIKPGSPTTRKWSTRTGDFTRPYLPTVTLNMFSRPVAFLAWVEHLDVERVRVHRRALDTCLYADVDLYGLCWEVNSSVDRPGSGPHLPGITVDWIRQRSGRRGDDAWISPLDLRATLSVLGVVEVVAS